MIDNNMFKSLFNICTFQFSSKSKNISLLSSPSVYPQRMCEILLCVVSRGDKIIEGLGQKPSCELCCPVFSWMFLSNVFANEITNFSRNNVT